MNVDRVPAAVENFMLTIADRGNRFAEKLPVVRGWKMVMERAWLRSGCIIVVSWQCVGKER